MISNNDERVVSRIFVKRLKKRGYWRVEHTVEKLESVPCGVVVTLFSGNVTVRKGYSPCPGKTCR